MVDARQEAIDAAVAAAKKVCDAAYATTPEQYHGFITLIGQNKRVGGTRQNPWYAAIELPYMRVDGRVTLAEDDHAERGEYIQLSEPEFYQPIPGHWMCKVTVTSSCRGTRIAHAKVELDATFGAAKDYPLEVAETSAIGRALGFMGYGLLGGGIASAEEVEGAQIGRAPAAPAIQEPDAIELPYTQAQTRLAELGIPFTHIKSLMARLEKMGNPPEAVLGDTKDADKLPRYVVETYMRGLGAAYKIEFPVIRQYMHQVFGVLDMADLSGAQQKALMGWLAMAEKDDWAEVLGTLEKETGYRIHPDIEGWILRKFGDASTRGLADLKKGTAWVVAAVGSDVCKSEIDAYRMTLAERKE